jgi:hypothetical protein
VGGGGVITNVKVFDKLEYLQGVFEVHQYVLKVLETY